MTWNTADICLYVRHASSSILLIALYEDDLLIASNSETVVAETKRLLRNRFEMKDLGRSRTILEMDISRKADKTV